MWVRVCGRIVSMGRQRERLHSLVILLRLAVARRTEERPGIAVWFP